MNTRETSGRYSLIAHMENRHVDQSHPVSRLAILLHLANVIFWIGMIAYGLITYGSAIAQFISAW